MRLNAAVPVIDADGRMAAHFRDEMARLSRAVPILGTGSPEGVVDGVQGQTYINTSGSSGSIFYVKKSADVGGDATQGWIAA